MMICFGLFGYSFNQVAFLHGVISDKEYDVILNCTTTNLNEAPMLPPSFRGSKSGSKDSMKQLVDKVNMNGQMLLSRTVTIIAVEVNCALLELCNGIVEESPLAQIAVSASSVNKYIIFLSFIFFYFRNEITPSDLFPWYLCQVFFNLC